MTPPPRSQRSIAIIGAGPGGLCMAIRLRRAGYRDFTLYERAPGIGGTWWHNRYPGAACDIPAHLYSFSFEPKVDWSRPYAGQPEILAYLEHCAAKYGLGPHLRLDTPVHSAAWDEAAARWRLVVGDGEPVLADVLVSGTGMFNDLHRPDIPGLDDFPGPVFHSARWDHGCELRGKRVGVIGSAASAVQFVPQVAKRAAAVYVHQRTANWVAPKLDEPFGEGALEHFRSDPAAAQALRQEIFDRIDAGMTFSDEELLRQSEQSVRGALAGVRDPAVRRQLTPDHPFGCKRPLVSNDYYPTFNQPHVELVTAPIERIRAGAIETADGTQRAVDVILLATGFETTRYASVVETRGRGGVSLDEAWAGDARAYLGVATAGFPNFFMLYGPNTNNGSILYMLECQVEYALRQLQRMDAEGLRWLEVRREAELRYDEALQRDLEKVAVWQAACSGYYRGASGRIVTQWPHSMSAYRARTERPDPEAWQSG